MKPLNLIFSQNILCIGRPYISTCMHITFGSSMNYIKLICVLDFKNMCFKCEEKKDFWTNLLLSTILTRLFIYMELMLKDYLKSEMRRRRLCFPLVPLPSHSPCSPAGKLTSAFFSTTDVATSGLLLDEGRMKVGRERLPEQ